MGERGVSRGGADVRGALGPAVARMDNCSDVVVVRLEAGRFLHVRESVEKGEEWLWRGYIAGWYL